MTNWVLLALVFLLSCSLTWLLKSLAIRNQLLDMPVARSAHVKPVPVGGGLAFVFCFYLAITWLYFQQSIPLHLYMALWGGAAVAALGFLDDLFQLGIKLRVAVQFAAALWTLLWLGDVPAIQLANWLLDIPLLIGFLSVVAMVWLINLYNFMDGIDGLAGVEASSVTALSLWFALNANDQLTASLSAVTCVSVAGFLVFNWPPAKIFMGDVGSGFLGYLMGAMALISMLNSTLNLWTWLLLLGVFVVDATITLLQRAISRQRWFEGHNTHAYQHATRRLGSHKLVTISVLLINLFWLAPLALYATFRPGMGVYLTLAGMIPLVLLALRLGAGKRI